MSTQLNLRDEARKLLSLRNHLGEGMDTPEESMRDRAIQSDWERAHELLDKHGVMAVGPGQMGVNLIERLEAVLKVWDAIGEHSAQCCHDLQFLCNSNPEVKTAIEANRYRRRNLGGSMEVEKHERDEQPAEVTSGLEHGLGFAEIPVTIGFKLQSQIGKMTIDLSKLPDAPGYCFAIGGMVLEEKDGVITKFQLREVSMVLDPEYRAYLDSQQKA